MHFRSATSVLTLIVMATGQPTNQSGLEVAEMNGLYETKRSR